MFEPAAPTTRATSRRQFISLLSALPIASACVAACSADTGNAPEPTSTPPTIRPLTSARQTASPRTPSHSAAPQDTRKTTVARLSLLQQAGQRVIYSYSGFDPPQELLQRVRTGQAGGVIFFGRNIAEYAQISAVIALLRQARRESPVSGPLLLMTDQEGGLIRRLPGPPAQSEQEIGRSADPRMAAAAAGAAAGHELADVGMNVNLAPVLDVSRGAGGFIDKYQRSYGGDPGADAILGSKFITAQQAVGVAATAKHFPGLGSAAAWQDTDSVPVELPVSASRLWATDEVPYRAAITAGVKLIMISWAIYPALDGSRPAGLSPLVVHRELRDRLGYAGVTISDALEAGALRGYGDSGQRAVASASAGVDLILCSSGDVSQGDAAAAALADALRLGRLDNEEFERASARIAALRSSLA
jgi:beta-N-acetylhexosaminidase